MKKNQSSPNSRTCNDLLVTKPDTTPLSYGGYVGASFFFYLNILNRMQVLHQSDLAISHDSQKMNHLRTKLSQKHSCSANDRVAQIEILLVCPLIDDKKFSQ